MSLSLTTRQCEPDVTVIEVVGRVALGRESGQIEAAVVKALEEGARKIVLDISGVSYIDSSGMGSVTFCFSKASREDGRFVVAGARGLVQEVFHITQIDTMVPFYPDVASALTAFAAPGTTA